MAKNINDLYDEALRRKAEADTERKETEKGPIDENAVNEATATLQKYKAGKAALDARIIDAETWFRQHHWANIRKDEKKMRQTGWLFSAIVNKHADFMDNKPEVNVLPREKSDQAAAQALTKIVPVVLQRGGWEEAFSEGCYQKIKFGGAIYSVLWDPDEYGGLGDVKLQNVDPLNFFWEPGVGKLQDSKNVFFVKLVDHEDIKAMYPGVPGLDRLSAPSIDVARYLFDENIDTSGKAYVVDWYYKKRVGGKWVLHYCRYVQDIVLFSTENAPTDYPNGWYADGKYPFVIDPFFPDTGTPFGFGLIDAMKDTQEDIDQSNDLFMKNMKQGARQRFFSSKQGGINEEEFTDLEKDIVHVDGSQLEERLKPIEVIPLSGTYVTIYENKVNELKENSFNRDVNSGGASGTTTASGIAALQEAGSKTSRDAIARTYRAYSEIVNMVIDRMRQFYSEKRSFRILGPNSQEDFVAFDNSQISNVPTGNVFGLDLGTREPVFDFNVKVSKQNAWSRAAQNQDVLNFYGMGFFDPQNSAKTLACLEVLEIDNKDRLTQVVQKNGIREQFNAQILPALLQAAAQVNPELGAAAMQAAQAAGLVQAPAGSEAQAPETGAKMSLTDNDVNGQVQENNRFLAQKRAEANDRTAPR